MEKIIVKQDSIENWRKAKNFIPKEGEIIIYVPKEGEIVIYDSIQIKIGDGKTPINQLPFSNRQYKYICQNHTLIIEEE